MTRTIDIEALCADKGLRITEQRRTLAKSIGLGTKRKRTRSAK
jgi:Fur family ferric uptake transcriptional regulator